MPATFVTLGLIAVVLVASAAPATADQTSPRATVGGAQLASTGLVIDAPGAAPLPKLTAASFVLADLDTGQVLAARDPHGDSVRPAP